MKQIILFIVIFIVGAISYPFLNSMLSSFTSKESVDTNTTTTLPAVSESNTDVTTVEPTETKDEPDVVVDELGAVHDGPFPIFDVNDKNTNATVEIIRSPEETLLQFKNVSFKHGSESQIYFATDRKNPKYMNLGPARLNSGVLIYGMPLDANLSIYKYILIFNPQTNVTEFYAEM